MADNFTKAKMKDVSRARSMAATLKKYSLWAEGFKLDEYPEIFLNLSRDFYDFSEALRDAPTAPPDTSAEIINIHDHFDHEKQASDA